MSEPVVIVGAGPAGLACATALRDAGDERPVVLLGDDPHPPYERPALSKELLRGETSASEIALTTREELAAQDIELMTGLRAAGADPRARSVSLDDGSTWPYGDLVLATGADPAVPRIPGADLARTLRRVEDSEGLRDAAGGRRVLVVGSGFIGCEAAVSLARGGAGVTLGTDERAPLEGRVGSEVASLVAGWLGEEGVELRTGAALQAIERHGEQLRAAFDDHRVETDLVLLALGIRRRLELASPLGLETAGDGIAVDSRMRAASHVYAVGDVAAALNEGADRRLNTEHWGDAETHGRVAGAALAGDPDAAWDFAPGFWSQIGDRTVKQVGWGDGFDACEVTHHDGGGFTARYGSRGTLVAVLTHEADDDYERGRDEVERGVPFE